MYTYKALRMTTVADFTDVFASAREAREAEDARKANEGRLARQAREAARAAAVEAQAVKRYVGSVITRALASIAKQKSAAIRAEASLLRPILAAWHQTARNATILRRASEAETRAARCRRLQPLQLSLSHAFCELGIFHTLHFDTSDFGWMRTVEDYAGSTMAPPVFAQKLRALGRTVVPRSGPTSGCGDSF
jgi:hypothetical protein